MNTLSIPILTAKNIDIDKYYMEQLQKSSISDSAHNVAKHITDTTN